jgi:uncharacterized membrane protein YgaE (UPF0421/DUF939 family)
VPKKFRAPKLHWSLNESFQRVIESVAPITQIVLAALTGYSFAHIVLGHSTPLLAVTVAIASLGFTRDARPRRIAETALGMVVGIALSEGLLIALGSGVWQLALTLLIALLAGRFISASAAFTITIAVQAMLVSIMPVPDGGVWVRSIDGVIGGVTALIFTAVIPRDPRRAAIRDAAKLFNIFEDSLNSLKVALRNVDVKVVDAALIRVRRSQPLVDNWRLSLDSAIAIARISPFLQKYRDELYGQLRIMRGMDLATRNLRVVVRRVDFLILDGKPRPYLADLIEQIQEGVHMLREALSEQEAGIQAEQIFASVISQLDPKKFGIADQISEASVLLLLRPMMIDLLCASGMSEDDARSLLPEI